ncbi:hypothetical protein J2Z69_003462 [Paenibacillus shirakamiensis]|uniref:Response regulatory domain-containing protein n=1 Tax=Paenibacillus shirakamiensis TaxID=1265935 RepID=A0ABS4JKZ5_9BACL|nr:hypothetical protein [Paenibacillus shirakamiensis]MBP2002389.1 hypothetical protein [Paenibacillus shirakamiensis]
MSYKYKILVVDDESLIAANFEKFSKDLKKKSNLDVGFTIIQNENQYDINEPYDILMVDYNLRKGFFNSSKQLGSEFIETFRSRNQISKIIFYSSEFEYHPVLRKYKFPFSTKEVFELINIWQVDKIASKNNYEMMVEVIADCCKQMDLLPMVLSKTLNEYRKNDIGLAYTNTKGEDIEVTDLFNDLLNDSEEGKHFREQVIKTVLSVLLNYKY